ncbi:MAG: hypothetical protein ACRC10_13100 [Thermoguttaceae bacterium]
MSEVLGETYLGKTPDFPCSTNDYTKGMTESEAGSARELGYKV